MFSRLTFSNATMLSAGVLKIGLFFYILKPEKILLEKAIAKLVEDIVFTEYFRPLCDLQTKVAPFLVKSLASMSNTSSSSRIALINTVDSSMW